jgi:L-threonylcarbamoyladenylate synthase
MKIVILKINPHRPEPPKIKLAASILKRGGLVAFPTDTVYGLGADATNPRAIQKIFKVKKRPLSNPLPILIAKKSDLQEFTEIRNPDESRVVKKITNKFWPGPLTIVLKKKKIIPNIVTAGKNSVGVRVPADAVALAIIRALGRPIAATSANLHGKPSPTIAMAVKKNLNTKIDLILDGGKTKFGVESTILDCATSPPTLIRLGVIPTKTIEKLIGKIKIGRRK